ncbi:MAG TPA: putative ABC exporter domain-containing protein [Verrucomicrobiae bacterium]|nr:putative ABC exporter domain-containing protein [Verrucomicrobiae bacterium]
MIAALFYLQWHTAKNRLTMRFKRLKQPKYLLGALVGGLYFYWYFFRVLLMPQHHGNGHFPVTTQGPADPLFFESIGALALLVFIVLAWVLPHKRAALTFSEAEVAFLFPAPVTRRTLIHFKLVRSQLRILFSVLFLTLISSRFGVNGHWLIRAAGWWVILFTLNLHILAASFSVTMLMDRGISNWKRRIAVLLPVIALAGFVIFWAGHELPQLTTDDLTNLQTIKAYAQQAFASGPLPYLLFPFQLVIRPYLAPDGPAFLIALVPALLVMLLHYLWVIRSDVAFEEASVEASQKFAEKLAAVRSGNWRNAGKKLKQKRAPFRLHPAGPAFMALFWKNLINAGSAFTARTWISTTVFVVVLSVGLHGFGSSSNWSFVIGMGALIFGAWTLLLGPQLARQDFRHDLPQMDMLKVFPLRGWQVALGEILAPAVILAALQWLLIIVAVVCLAPSARGHFSPGLVLVMGAGAALVAPMFNLISLTIPNAAVLLFPAWFQTGKDAPHGIEATGQRLIFALGQFLAFIVALVPATAVFAGIFFAVKFLAGVTLAVAAATVAATLVLAVEAALGVLLLGWLFQRFDISGDPAT